MQLSTFFQLFMQLYTFKTPVMYDKAKTNIGWLVNILTAEVSPLHLAKKIFSFFQPFKSLMIIISI